MSGLGLVFSILLGGVLLFSLWRASQRKQHMEDPDSPEAMQARRVLDALDERRRESLAKEVKAGRNLNAIAQLRRAVPGLGLEAAKDVIELLDREA